MKGTEIAQSVDVRFAKAVIVQGPDRVFKFSSPWGSIQWEMGREVYVINNGAFMREKRKKLAEGIDSWTQVEGRFDGRSCVFTFFWKFGDGRTHPRIVW